jgi:peroxiredoxin
MKIKIITKKTFLIIPCLGGVIISFLIFTFLLESFFVETKEINTPSDFVEITNEIFPEVKLNDLTKDIDYFDKIKNGKVLLMFFHSKCSACKRETDIINKAYYDLPSDIKVYGASFEDKEKLSDFVKDYQVKFPVVQSGIEPFKQFQIRYFPTNFYIEDGIIKKSWVGTFKDEQELFEKIKNFGTRDDEKHNFYKQ